MTMKCPSAPHSTTQLRAVVDQACARPAPDIDDAVVEEVVSTLKRVSRDATLQMALDVGHVVVEKLFAGDMGQFRSRAAKSLPLRKLATHPDLPFSATTLWRSIRIYELVKRMPEIVQHRHIGVAHLRSVLSLPPPEQESVLREATNERWTVQQIEARVAGRSAGHSRLEGGIRNNCPELLARVRRMERELLSGEQAHAAIPADFEEADRREVAARVRRVRAWCDQMLATVDAER